MERLKTMSTARLQRRKRRGAIAAFAALLMTTIIAMVAFAIDYGFILKKRSELQRAADAAAGRRDHHSLAATWHALATTRHRQRRRGLGRLTTFPSQASSSKAF